MGEVWRATDTKLNRDVAIKILPDVFAQDADRMARFAREAQVLAALNHPNIAAIYGLEERALVMELVEGETLQCLFPIETALNYAKQIADALEAAHEKGIVHRDLKPANIKVKPDGTVKVLDFGLAKSAEASSGDSRNSPTLTISPTRAGMIMGTAGYMSPEQAAGKPVDKRSDIWAFGVVLWEMLTGTRLFEGETISHTLADVLRAPIELDKLPKNTPPAIRRLIARCLDRNVNTRLRDVGEARIAIANYLADPKSGAEVAESTPRPKVRYAWLPWALSILLFLALAGALVWIFRPAAAPRITRFAIPLGEGQQFSNFGRSYLALSPDGTQLVYIANRRLYIRSMAESEARPISGTESAGGNLSSPVFSPDGKSLAFYSAGAIKRIAISGGAAVTICRAGNNPFGMSWSEQGIVFQQVGQGIMLVSGTGGQPELLVKGKDGERIMGPQMLPGGHAVLFTTLSGTLGSNVWDKGQIVVQVLKSGERKALIDGGSDGHYLPTGHIVYGLTGILFAVPFDLRHLKITSGPVGIVEGIERDSSGTAHFAFSNSGSMAYVSGPMAGIGQGQDTLALVDRKGDAELLKVPPDSYGYPRVSQDGKRVAYQIDDGKESSIWIYELSGATAPRRLTLPGTGANRYPIWSRNLPADSERVAFQSDREGDPGIWWQRADGSGAAERLTKPEKGSTHIPDSWSPDGQILSFTEERNGSSAVWTYSVRDKKATVFAASTKPFLGRSVFSPNGRWLAYQESSVEENQIYIQPYPPTGAKYQVPHDGSTHHPAWSPDGKELFFVAGNGLFDSVTVATQPSLTFGTPVRAPKAGFRTFQASTVRTYDVLPDGQHFIGTALAQAPAGNSAGRPAPPQIQVVLNWFEDVRQRASGR